MICRVIILVAVVLSLAGCAQLRTRDDYWISPGQEPVGNKAVSLLYYADYVRNLPPPEYTREAEHARQFYAREKSDFRSLQYALALSAPGGDPRKAQQVIEPLLRQDSNSDKELIALARLLEAQLEEHRRLEAATMRADELEKKVDAIKNIERSMIERGKNSGVSQ